VITVKTAMGRLVSKVRSWQFSQALARAEKRPANIATIANHVEPNWSIGMTALLGVWSNSKPTHKDWTK
jgi:hypothetical protein